MDPSTALRKCGKSVDSVDSSLILQSPEHSLIAASTKPTNEMIGLSIIFHACQEALALDDEADDLGSADLGSVADDDLDDYLNQLQDEEVLQQTPTKSIASPS